MLHLENLHKSFGSTEVLHGVSLDARKGEVVAVIGPSGSGKTTLLRCLNGLETSDAGRLTLEGTDYDLARLTRREWAALRKRTAFVFQNYNLFLNHTVLENVTLGPVVGHGMKPEAARERARVLLARVGLEGRDDAYPNELSGGQQQRVAIARALATDPAVIYFDEPTSALDAEWTDDMHELLRGVAAQGTTMVVVTHALDFARSVSDWVVFMEAGRVVETGDTETFFTSPKTARTRAFLDSEKTRDETNDKGEK